MSRFFAGFAVMGLVAAVAIACKLAPRAVDQLPSDGRECGGLSGVVAEPTLDDCGPAAPVCGWDWAEPTSTEVAAISDPLGVLTGRINNKQLYDRFVRVGTELLATPRGLDVAAIQQRLRSNFAAARPRPPVAGVEDSFPYPRVAQSSLMLGTLYDCGKCDDMHGNVAGGVIISADGLCLTNHHVLERRDEDTRLLFAMDYAGRGYAIEEILAVDRQADVALIRLSGDGPFVPSPLASDTPRPNSPAYVLSHPSNEFYLLTQGIVSRHVTLTHRRGSSQWLEITAPFGAGSSGSGIFNERGELIGLVSRIQPIFRSPTQINAPEEGAETRPGRTPYAELILRRCVTLEAIQRCFDK